ncbi:hypothetical protein OG874_01655 [Nocardia sp. NBC_00565]|nr:hypothetical protein [Nocardia sp. NBC_00565]WUC03947.1 hypothetical protein OG874_01655 [Nocardia sp. NBC_00565]
MFQPLARPVVSIDRGWITTSDRAARRGGGDSLDFIEEEQP